MYGTYFREDHTHDMASRRKEDHAKEKIISDFLEKYVYPEMGVKTTPVTDKDLQIAGVDKIFDYKDKQYFCDEKAATGAKYWNVSHTDRNGNPDYSPLGTFCMECFQKPRGSNHYTEGWFLNPNKCTNSYLLVWVDNATPSKGNPNMWDSLDNIQHIQCAFVSSDKVMKYVNDKGISLDLIYQTCEEISKGEKTFKWVNGVKFNRLDYFGESPINIQLNRDDYFKMADFALDVTVRNGVPTIKKMV